MRDVLGRAGLVLAVEWVRGNPNRRVFGIRRPRDEIMCD
jgi:hypothetical protein